MKYLERGFMMPQRETPNLTNIIKQEYMPPGTRTGELPARDAYWSARSRASPKQAPILR